MTHLERQRRAQAIVKEHAKGKKLKVLAFEADLSYSYVAWLVRQGRVSRTGPVKTEK